MSASLVGSEMCIRDSAAPIARTLPWGAVAEKGVEGRAQSGRMPPSRNVSVSYTHLTLPTICSV
eukprot:9983530-Alexandrium_andersonii.AAC.1